MHNLTLYYMPMCPFCIKVLNFLKKKGLSVLLKDISTSDQYEQELIKIGGKGQVPCLVINGKALYESDDIIEWFERQT